MDDKKHRAVQREQETSLAPHMSSDLKPEQSMLRDPLAAQTYQRVLGGPRVFAPTDLLRLQRTIGNQSVQRLLATTAQRQVISPPQEASFAPTDKVSQLHASVSSQKDALQRQVEDASVQRVSEPTSEKANTTGLPDTLKAGIENLSGLSLDDVQVHYNSSEPAQLQALAYTQGTEIHVGPGQERHLAHEAWHVVQQKQGRVKPTWQAKGVAINDEEELEREADVMGKTAEHKQLPQSWRTVGDGTVKRTCAECEEDLVQGQELVQGKGIIQRYDECSESTHYTDRYHRWLQRRYKRKFPGGRAEYSLTNANGNWNFIDIADVDDKEVYEIKSANQGAAAAATEAQEYVNLLKSAVGCKGAWKLGRVFDTVWVTEGGGEKLTGWCPQKGAILYTVEDIDLTSSESEPEMDTDE